MFSPREVPTDGDPGRDLGRSPAEVDEATPSLRPRAAPIAADLVARPPRGLPTRRDRALVIGAAMSGPLGVAAAVGSFGAESVLAAVIVGLVVERAFTRLHGRYLGEIEYRQLRLEAKVRERTAELELANIALRHEIEERNEVQRQLVDAERLAVAGGVAAGVCHEVRNPLSALMGNVELAMERVDEPEAAAEIRALLSAAMEGARQVEAVTQDLQTLARPGEERGASAEVRAVVDAAVRLAMPHLRGKCEVEVTVADGRVQLGASRLVQVLLNLLINAGKAGRPGARNRVHVRTVTADTGFVALEVQDNGVGMDAEVQKHVFEPFFTTRREQGGTGLGLYLSRTIARTAGGSLTFRSAPGVGTTFRITLPVVP
jgi:signal transduction histidine kinase